MTLKRITILYCRLAFAVNKSNVQRQDQLNDSVCIYIQYAVIIALM